VHLKLRWSIKGIDCGAADVGILVVDVGFRYSTGLGVLSAD
jgi:hypothetical protein